MEKQGVGKWRDGERGRGEGSVDEIAPCSPAGADYTPGTFTIVFPVNTTNGTEACIRIDILDDLLFEKKENFSVHLQFSEPNIVVHGPRYIPVEICSDDSESVCVCVCVCMISGVGSL